MSGRLVIGYHLIWTAYGHWLPNDPRGSGSTTVVDPRLAALGELHLGRKPKQPPGSTIRAFYERAREVLKFAYLEFGAREFAMIAEAFAEVIDKNHYTCYACAIMPDHVHLIVRKHRHLGEEMTEFLQDASCDRLRFSGWCEAEHPVWTLGGWKRYLFEPNHLRKVIRYIERNPLERGLPAQRWPFVKKYDGWPLHPGHDPNSPWARGLRGQP